MTFQAQAISQSVTQQAADMASTVMNTLNHYVGKGGLTEATSSTLKSVTDAVKTSLSAFSSFGPSNSRLSPATQGLLAGLDGYGFDPSATLPHWEKKIEQMSDKASNGVGELLQQLGIDLSGKLYDHDPKTNPKTNNGQSQNGGIADWIEKQFPQNGSQSALTELLLREAVKGGIAYAMRPENRDEKAAQEAEAKRQEAERKAKLAVQENDRRKFERDRMKAFDDGPTSVSRRNKILYG